MSGLKVLIIGGGIAGLCAAVALRRAGIEPLLCERAPAFGDVGAGITLWANALRALDHIGAGDAVRARARQIDAGELKRPDGRVLMRIDYTRFERERALPRTLWVLHRADLVDALAGLLPIEYVRFNRRITSVEQTSTTVTATFADGSRETGDALIGADGIQSTVRESLWGRSIPRYAGYTCWRGVATLPTFPSNMLYEVWGRGLRVGMSSLPGERVFWFTVADAPPQSPGTPPDDETTTRTLLARFSGWAEPVPAVIGATPAGAIIRNDIIDLPPHRPWSKGRVLLIGDAAHSTTPNLGQGGCMAIEDAPVLARSLAQAPTIHAAFANFERARFRRTAKVTIDSWRFGKLGQGSSPLVALARDWLALLTPGRFAFAQLGKLSAFDTGPIGAPRS